ncbi:uncharacterized protein NMK_2430 [Novimethylophilus kurashikiensis]|uniref:Uncharacterized protein n=1 Tax=Novimethylophilus kurashikiensis TaxID=1825523 RepID=A0A2R5FAI3_9PROT|nr:hypothetical protein [Novimethylophilus kurashikiensis]GBG14829.1 uncharacterized protein NMK_2430 [Novimethylophilus kurashikiensis]
MPASSKQTNRPKKVPGIIYIANPTKLNDSIKYGKAKESVGVIGKQKSYMTTNKDFAIKMAWNVDDIHSAEREGLAKLRLVAGTDYKGPGREIFPFSVSEAARICAPTTLKKQLSEARELILKKVVLPCGMTAHAALLWMRAHMDDAKVQDRWIALVVELDSFGISFLPPWESATVVGVLEDPKSLFRKLPNFEVYIGVLEPGTDLYLTST